MCAEKNEQDKKPATTIGEFLSAISENEYPQYILDVIGRVREWMTEMTEEEEDSNEEDIFSAIFGDSFEYGVRSIEGLLGRLEDIREYADIIPNTRQPEGKSDAVIISITPPDYESGLRSAIDYAAVFNRGKCRRVWIISDTFIFDEVIKFSPHVDALAEQGITLRYVLVTPWGWVELPLSGLAASKQSFLWRNEGLSDEHAGYKRRKQ